MPAATSAWPLAPRLSALPPSPRSSETTTTMTTTTTAAALVMVLGLVLVLVLPAVAVLVAMAVTNEMVTPARLPLVEAGAGVSTAPRPPALAAVRRAAAGSQPQGAPAPAGQATQPASLRPGLPAARRGPLRRGDLPVSQPGISLCPPSLLLPAGRQPSHSGPGAPPRQPRPPSCRPRSHRRRATTSGRIRGPLPSTGRAQRAARPPE